MRAIPFKISITPPVCFGSPMTGRNYHATGTGKYRYGFNGKEKDGEIKGDGNQQDYGMRIYDARIGKFLSVDPISKEYPELTPYQFASNSPVAHIDLDGLEKVIYLINMTGDKVTTTKIELTKVGSLGNGIAVQMTKNGKTTSFYGNKVASAEQFTKSHEGTVLKRYNDQYGFPTIGTGHLIKDSEEEKYPLGSTITAEEDAKLFSADYSEKSKQVGKNLNGVELSQNQLDALVDFGFNTGAGKVKQYTPEQGGNFFLKFLKGGDGIVKRRIGEFLMFTQNVYAHFDKLGSKATIQLDKTISDAQSAPQEPTQKSAPAPVPFTDEIEGAPSGR